MKRIVLALAGIFICSLLFIVFYFAPLFSIRFGGELEWYIIVIAFFRNNPFNVGKAGQVSTGLLFINALFWTLLIAIVFQFILRFFSKKDEEGKR